LIPCARSTPGHRCAWHQVLLDNRALVRERIDPLAIAAQPLNPNPQT
jgi:hypothetical protein